MAHIRIWWTEFVCGSDCKKYISIIRFGLDARAHTDYTYKKPIGP